MRLTRVAGPAAMAAALVFFLSAAPIRGQEWPVVEEEAAAPAAESAAPPVGEETEEELRHAIETALERPPIRRSARTPAQRARRDRIDALVHPAPDDITAPTAAPLRARIWRGLGRAAESVSAHELARAAFERSASVADGASDCAARRGLARMRLRDGALDEAEATWLDALERGCRDPETWRELGELYLLSGDPDSAQLALEAAADAGGPAAERARRLLARARFEATPGLAPRPETEEPAWPRAEERDWRVEAEQAAEALRDALTPVWRERLDALASPRGVRAATAALVLLAMLWIALRWLRGRGDLVVAIEYPNELRGTFSVRLATQKGRFKRRDRSERLSVLEGGNSSRNEHHLVGRETQFRRLPVRRYWVTVEGLIQDPDTEEILTDHFEEQCVTLMRRKTTRLPFDFAPRECPLDMKILWDKKPVKEACVGVRGRPQALRFARGGGTRMALPRGRHVVAVGAGDRVVEREIDVTSFQTLAIEIDLAGGDTVIFKGCPPAVEPYLHGDLASAARELEREGQTREANLLLARLHREEGSDERAADHYEKAGQWIEAARLRADSGDAARAAELFSRAGDALRAAEMFAEAGDPVRAGECYEKAGDFENAIRCYETAGEAGRWIDALERRGRFFEAAQVALQADERARAIRLLQMVPSDHPRIVEAATWLADALEQEGHLDLAAQRLEQIAGTWGPEDGTPDLRDRLAGLHEKSGQLERALELLEQLRQQEPTWPNVATRIESIRKRITARSSGGRLSGSDLATTGFLGDQRYELLEEIGRGGMGVVFRARDKRLDRVVALKRLPDNLRDHPKAIQLFLREAQASARLTHRNITTVYDADQADGVFFITMELLQGQPLNRILRRKKRLSVRDAALLGIQIAEGLAYAHGQRVVHRDIKTANLFFTLDRTVKIMDFGLAKMMEEVRRSTTVIGGTPYYMAPEQGAGESVDHRADLYAFGVTLFELITGRLPFADGDVTYHHRHTPPPDPREFVPEVPAALAELIAEMLAKRPEDRIASADEVRQRLEGIARAEG